jgi:hypothetical protein
MHHHLAPEKKWWFSKAPLIIWPAEYAIATRYLQRANQRTQSHQSQNCTHHFSRREAKTTQTNCSCCPLTISVKARLLFEWWYWETWTDYPKTETKVQWLAFKFKFPVWRQPSLVQRDPRPTQLIDWALRRLSLQVGLGLKAQDLWCWEGRVDAPDRARNGPSQRCNPLTKYTCRWLRINLLCWLIDTVNADATWATQHVALINASRDWSSNQEKRSQI